jgi:hypothetical protein
MRFNLTTIPQYVSYRVEDKRGKLNRKASAVFLIRVIFVTIKVTVIPSTNGWSIDLDAPSWVKVTGPEKAK